MCLLSPSFPRPLRDVCLAMDEGTLMESHVQCTLCALYAWCVGCALVCKRAWCACVNGAWAFPVGVEGGWGSSGFASTVLGEM